MKRESRSVFAVALTTLLGLSAAASAEFISGERDPGPFGAPLSNPIAHLRIVADDAAAETVGSLAGIDAPAGDSLPTVDILELPDLDTLLEGDRYRQVRLVELVSQVATRGQTRLLRLSAITTP